MEKVTSLLSFALFLRLFLPGAIGVFLLFPVLNIGVSIAVQWGNYPSFSPTVLVLGTLVAVGVVVILLDHPVYRLYEGYFFPRTVRECLTRRLNQKITEKLKQAAAFKASQKDMDYALVWEWLSRFVVEEETTTDITPKAISPTHFGNILYQYETYPFTRYGIDGVFYWPRLWLALDDETRKELEVTWAWGDASLYVSAVCYFSGIINAVTFLLHVLDVPTRVGLGIVAVKSQAPKALLFLVLTVLGLILGWIAYRISLPVHYRIGEYFKATYDLHRGKLEPMTKVSREPEKLKEEKSHWEKTRKLLDFLKKE